MLFAFIGRSGTGKSTIAKKIIEKTLFNEIHTWTTRPMRSGEVNGVDYNFTTNEAFINMLQEDKIVAYKYIEARDWHYGINISDIENLGINKLTNDNHAVVVITPDGYDELKSIFKNQVVGIYIDTKGKDLVLRSLKREENPDVYEICRRYLSDEEDFLDIDYDFKVENNGNLSETISHITGIIRGVLYGCKQI